MPITPQARLISMWNRICQREQYSFQNVTVASVKPLILLAQKAKFHMNMKQTALVLISLMAFAGGAAAQTPEDPAVTACKATGLVALQGQSADITGLVFDVDSLAVSAADTKVEDVSVKTVVLGEAYIERKGTAGKADRFVCLVGEKGKVLLTFFTAK